jgi:chemotaxis response regulator CheB
VASSVSLLGASALQLYAPQAIVGVMLTGMGSDGAEAFADIRKPAAAPSPKANNPRWSSACRPN